MKQARHSFPTTTTNPLSETYRPTFDLTVIPPTNNMSSFLAIAALAATAAAHGTVTGFVTDGVYNKGYDISNYYLAQQGQKVAETAAWSAENLDNGFVAPDAYTTADIVCHKNAKAATSSATVKAGGKIDFQWSKWPESHVGPMLTYVAKCDGDCSSADKTSLAWVKIDGEGFTDDWASNKMIANNNTWSITVPSTLASGKYVFRHETIALHSAGSEGGAQNYPQCMNIEITGGGSDNPEGTVGTKLYTPQDKGILFNVYGGDNSAYVVPGPKLYGAGSSTTPATPTTSKPASSAPASSAPASSAPAPTASSAAEPSSAPAPGNGNGSAKTFTVQSFIAWLEEQSAGAAKAKARRHARAFA